MPSDRAQPWAEENLQHNAESNSVPETKARALQGSRESLVHGVEVNDELGQRAVPALSTCSQTSSVLLGIELSGSSSTGWKFTKPGLSRETEAPKLDSAGEWRRVSAAKFSCQSSFQPKSS